MNNCPKCGAEADLGDKFCSGCGNELLVKSSSLDSRIIDLLRQQRFIEAVKLVRQNENLGLKESKDYVESVAKQSGIEIKQMNSANVLIFAALMACAIIGLSVYLIFLNLGQ